MTIQPGKQRTLNARTAMPPRILQPAPGEPTRLRLSGNWLRAAKISWITLAIAAVAILAASLPGYALKFGGQLGHSIAAGTTPGTRFFAIASGLASLLSALLSLGLSWMLFRQKFSEVIGAVLAFYLLAYGIVMAGPLEKAASYWLENATVATSLQGYLMAAPTIVLFALFPNGRLVPGWMRWVLMLTVPWSMALFFLPPLTTANISRQPVAFTLLALVYLILTSLGIYAQITRYRRVSTPAEREQTKWVVFGFVLWVFYIVLTTGPYFYLEGLPPGSPTPWWAPASELGWWLSLNIIPVSLTVAITRQRLWNIDLVINRTLVYAALTFSVIALYVLVIGGLGLVFQSGDYYVLSLLATGLAAVLFQPLREQLQASVNRLMYGDRDNPAEVLALLGEQLQRSGTPEATLLRIVETVARALKSPYAAIHYGKNGEPAASYGLPVDQSMKLPLVYQGEDVGQLVIGHRSGELTFSPQDFQLLENITHHAGPAVHNARLTADLLRARQRLVSAREEERRRIRRDLHDGLGPQLANLNLKIDAARNLYPDSPQEADEILQQLKTDTKSALAEIRRIAYGLRPPALDELGLVSALRETINAQKPPGLQISFSAPQDLRPLPAAVEVAAYRIAIEALANVLRHAQAKVCQVTLEIHQNLLLLEVTDDGVGLPPGARAGVGFASMRERASELGGKWLVQSRPDGGTRIQAQLPLPQPAYGSTPGESTN